MGGSGTRVVLTCADVFPGLSEAINDVDVERAMRWAYIIKERIQAATKTLSL